MRAVVGETPVILTCRGDWEGGFKKVSDEAKFGVYEAAVKEALVDFIDVELIYGEDKIKKVLELLDGTKTSLIVSFHDFKKTPSRDELVSILKQQIAAGAHVAKLRRRCRRRRRTFSTCSSATLEVQPPVPLYSHHHYVNGAPRRSHAPRRRTLRLGPHLRGWFAVIGPGTDSRRGASSVL